MALGLSPAPPLPAHTLPVGLSVPEACAPSSDPFSEPAIRQTGRKTFQGACLPWPDSSESHLASGTSNTKAEQALKQIALGKQCFAFRRQNPKPCGMGLKGNHISPSPMSTGEPWVKIPGEKFPSLAMQGGHPSSQAEMARPGITSSPPDLPTFILSQRKVPGCSLWLSLGEAGLLCFPDLLATGTSLPKCLWFTFGLSFIHSLDNNLLISCCVLGTILASESPPSLGGSDRDACRSTLAKIGSPLNLPGRLPPPVALMLPLPLQFHLWVKPLFPLRRATEETSRSLVPGQGQASNWRSDW